MKTPKTLIISGILILFQLNLIQCQDTIQTTKFEAGIDFIRFNREWVYYSGSLNPSDGINYSFDLIPSLFLKMPLKKVSLRFKYEFFKKPYSFETNSIDDYQQIEGNLTEHRFSIGLEKYFLEKKFRLYYQVDCGISFSNFNGLYSYDNIDLTVLSDPFNVRGITFFIQPGAGAKFALTGKLDLNLESALWFGKGYDRDDNHHINPSLRFIPRPISLFGLSYKFKSSGSKSSSK
jgi:hypothetical protein